MKTATHSLIAIGVLTTLAAAASAHVSLKQPIAEVGSAYQAVLGLGHGCDGAATTAVAVRIPTGFDAARPLPKPGGKLALRARTDVVQGDAALRSGQRGLVASAGRGKLDCGPEVASGAIAGA